MAKVYDALKRVQEQRSRQTAASPEVFPPPVVLTPAPAAGVWRRWIAPWARADHQPQAAGRSNVAVGDRVEALLHRIDRLEQHTSVNLLERHVVDAIEARIRTLEQELTARIADAVAEQGRRVEHLAVRMSLVVGLLTLLCIEVFFRR